MAADPHLTGAQAADADVMAALDEVEGTERLVISDVSRDGAWLSTPSTAAVSLRAWR